MNKHFLSEAEFRKEMDDLLVIFSKIENEKKKRGWRDKVDPLTLDYSNYKKTKLWKQIKTRILERDQSKCQRCKGRAEVVHHISYLPMVMLGLEDSQLISLCSGCHNIVHFDSFLRRRT